MSRELECVVVMNEGHTFSEVSAEFQAVGVKPSDGTSRKDKIFVVTGNVQDVSDIVGDLGEVALNHLNFNNLD